MIWLSNLFLSCIILETNLPLELLSVIDEMLYNKRFLTSLIIISYFACAMCWLDLINTFPIGKQGMKGKKFNSTKLILGAKNSGGCRKDRLCQPSEFCHRYERTCMACRREGQLCRRNKMCCRGMECASGKCRRKIKLRTEGALCNKDRDCNYGYCCAKEKGQSVCKKMLKEGDRCSKPSNAMYLWSHQCPCEYGLKCRKPRRALDKILELIRDWNQQTDRRCVRSSYSNT